MTIETTKKEYADLRAKALAIPEQADRSFSGPRPRRFNPYAREL